MAFYNVNYMKLKLIWNRGHKSLFSLLPPNSFQFVLTAEQVAKKIWRKKGKHERTGLQRKVMLKYVCRIVSSLFTKTYFVHTCCHYLTSETLKIQIDKFPHIQNHMQSFVLCYIDVSSGSAFIATGYSFIL